MILLHWFTIIFLYYYLTFIYLWFLIDIFLQQFKAYSKIEPESKVSIHSPLYHFPHPVPRCPTGHLPLAASGTGVAHLLQLINLHWHIVSIRLNSSVYVPWAFFFFFFFFHFSTFWTLLNHTILTTCLQVLFKNSSFSITKKSPQVLNNGVSMEKRESSQTLGGNINWCSQ